MDLAAAGLHEQPFRTHGKPLSIVPYESHRQAIDALHQTCDRPYGLALLQGPTLSGKTTLLRYFLQTLDDDRAAAIVDGDGLNATALLEAVLRQFGYELDYKSANELFAMLRVFALQQAASHHPPLLIVENTQSLNPSALRTLCEFAALRARFTSAIKLVLASNRSLASIVDAPAMDCIKRRVTADFHFRPMSSDEAKHYLHTKLRMAGSDVPEFVLPSSTCLELWQASGGWPGVLDRLALLALAKAETLPVAVAHVEHPVLPQGTWFRQNADDANDKPDPPELYVTHEGDILQKIIFDTPRLLIGRSEHNDVSISSKFISRHHLLLVRHGGSTMLMDLNSSNGTYVNSRRISNHVLVHNDVITVGHHRLKFYDRDATVRSTLDSDEFAETAVMKSLDDMRRLLAQENTDVLPSLTENLPTIT